MIRLANNQDISVIYELGTILHKNYRIVNDLEKMIVNMKKIKYIDHIERDNL